MPSKHNVFFLIQKTLHLFFYTLNSLEVRGLLLSLKTLNFKL